MAPPPEGDQEGLRDQVIGGIGTQPPGNITADRRRMPVEQHPETLRRVQRPRDKRSIIAGPRASISRDGCLPCRVTHIGPLSPDSVHPLSPDEASRAPRNRPTARTAARPGASCAPRCTTSQVHDLYDINAADILAWKHDG
jgi:hypothetical protein